MIETGPFPHLNTDRITISQPQQGLGTNRVSVRASLSSYQDESQPFWFNEEIFSSFIKIYFILVSHPGEVIPGTLTTKPVLNTALLRSPSARYKNVMQFFETQEPLQWDSKLLSEYPSKVITLSDAVSQNQDSIIVTPQSSIMENTPHKFADIFFEVDIDFENPNVTPSNNRLKKMELVAFTHLDVNALVSEFNLPVDNNIKSLLAVGGNSTYDLLLDRRNNNKLMPPKTRTILVTNDGSPYVGDFHYHANNSGPGGYTGYMEGPENHPNMASMRRLRSSEIQNTKIVARAFIDDSEFISGYYGAPIKYTEDANGDLLPGIYPNYNPHSVSMLPLLSQDPSNLSVTSLRGAIDKFYEDPLRSAGRKIAIGESQWITIPSNQELMSHYGVRFGIDFLSLIRQNSKYGFFLSLQKLEAGIMFPSVRGAVKKIGIENLLSRTRIDSIRVKRVRVSNSPRSNNPVGTADYDLYDRNELPRFLVESRDIQTDFSFRKTLLHASNSEFDARFGAQMEDELENLGIRDISPRPDDIEAPAVADICEIPMVNEADPRFVRTFQVRDYEIFSKINYGYYKYSVDLIIEDNIKGFFLQKVGHLQTRIAQFKEFVEDASRPVMPQKIYFGADTRSFPSEVQPEERDQALLDGNYIASSEKYTRNFIEVTSIRYERNIENLIDLYLAMTDLLSPTEGSAAFTANRQRTDVNLRYQTLIIPSQGGRLKEAEAFLENCRELLKIYLSFLDKDNVQSVGAERSNTEDYIFLKEKRSISKTEPKFIRLSLDLNLVVKSFVDGELMVSYGVGDSESGEVDVRAIQSRSPLGNGVGGGGGGGFEATDFGPGISELPDLQPVITTIPNRFTFSNEGVPQDLLTYNDYQNYSEAEKNDASRFLRQVTSTPPDRTFFEFETGKPSFANSSAMSGLSVGIPVVNAGLAKLESVNVPRGAAGTLRSGIISANLEKVLSSVTVPPSNESLIQKSKNKSAKEDSELSFGDPRVRTAAQILTNVQTSNSALQTREVSESYSNNLMRDLSTNPQSEVKTDIFSENQARVKILSSEVKFSDFEPLSVTRVELAINSIPDVVEVVVEASLEQPKTRELIGVTPPAKVPVNTNGYVKLFSNRGENQNDLSGANNLLRATRQSRNTQSSAGNSYGRMT